VDATIGWARAYNNVATPWVDISGAAVPLTNNMITFNDATLYVRNVKPKYAIYAAIMDEYLESDKPVFYNAITTVCAYTGITQSSQQTIILGTTMANPDYLVFGFQINQGNPATTSAAYTAGTAAATPSTYIGASAGNRTTDGASNFSVFDSLNLQRSVLSYGTMNYPVTSIDSDWYGAHNANLNVKLIQQLRKEYFGIDDGKESSPIINSQNWVNLYPLYVVDLRPKQKTVNDNPAPPSTNQLQLTFNSPIPYGVNMYYMFLGNKGFECNNTTTVIKY
jgi:hypothetical protein